MESSRKLLCDEVLLLEFLVRRSTVSLPSDWKNNLLVQPMNDGEMGSLLLFPEGITNKVRSFGAQVSEAQFIDEDGVTVIASLNVDNTGKLFELDIWKTDFRPLVSSFSALLA